MHVSKDVLGVKGVMEGQTGIQADFTGGNWTRAAVDGTLSQLPVFLTFNFYLGVKVTQMLLSALHIMSPMHLQSLKLLYQRLRRICIMHLQKKTLYDLDLGVKVT